MEVRGEEVTHVLLGEDDNEDYYIFSLAIAEIKFNILLARAENGERLMELLRDKLPDILFLDILMPYKDGHDCLKEIRADRRFDKLPIIIYTSMEDLANIELCYREGSNLYVVKPSTVDQLKGILDKIFTIDWKKVLYFPTRSNFVINSV